MRARKLRVLGALIAALTVVAGAIPATASGHRDKKDEPVFDRIASFSVYTNNEDPTEETVAEIVDASADGMTLVYTDSPLDQIGFVDISDPADPQPAGVVDVGGEPTSVSVTGNYAAVGVNTSESFVEPSGKIVIVDMTSREIVDDLDLAGQPDSVKASPDGRYIAVAIENERDEDIIVDEVEGGLPQAPAGLLQIVDFGDFPNSWAIRDVDLTGLAEYAPGDPEPEFVDVNERNQAVVTMQENNHVVVVDLRKGTVTRDFTAGTVTLEGVDATEDDVISLTETIEDVPREPDAVTWVGNRVATANEGDLFGGSRGFTVFNQRGRALYDAGSSYDALAVRHGHYPEGRSENKGSEPESIVYDRYGRDDLLFVGSERGSFVAVYDVSRKGRQVEFSQFLPTGLGPEGLLTIPDRDLFVVSAEVDEPEFGVRATITIYQRTTGEAFYPQVASVDDADGNPIAWSAMSGLGEVPGTDSQAYAVWDSFYGESRIFTMDLAADPALVTDYVTITGGTGDYDPEGVTAAPDGTLWVASEGNRDGSRPNRLLQVNTDGELLAEIGLPAEIEACRAASEATGSLGAGFEGLTAVEVNHGHGYVLLVAQQRGWNYTTDDCQELDDDPNDVDDSEPGQTRIWQYDPAWDQWTYYSYELEDKPENAAWVGLSEITQLDDTSFVVIERDNRTGDWSELKTLVNFDWASMDDGIVTSDEKTVLDIEPELEASNGWITDKPEGFVETGDGNTYVITDNDGVDDWSGETWLLRLGEIFH